MLLPNTNPFDHSGFSGSRQQSPRQPTLAPRYPSRHGKDNPSYHGSDDLPHYDGGEPSRYGASPYGGGIEERWPRRAKEKWSSHCEQVGHYASQEPNQMVCR